MKFHGQEIGESATLLQVSSYCAEKGLFVNPQQAYDYWSKKGWKNAKGLNVKTLENCIDCVNSIAIRKEQKKKEKEKNKLKRKQRKEARRKAKEIDKENKRETSFIYYADQLKDERWKAFREFVFKIRGKKCEICGSTEKLQVHHIHYNKGVKAWEYNVNEVLVACVDCHRNIHGIKE